MKKLRKFLATPGVSLCAIALGILLLGTSTVGGARAAMTYYSNDYQADVQLQQIQVQLYENGTMVSDDGEMNGSLPLSGIDAGNIKLGVDYKEELTVTNPVTNKENTVNITEYVRVTIRRYWVKPDVDADGKTIEVKQDQLDPTLIQLGLTTGEGWIEDLDARTDERIVLYYTQPLDAGKTTPAFVKTLTIDPEVGTIGTRNDDGTITYAYDGAQFKLEVTVDAIQNKKPEDAALSAWGQPIQFENANIVSLG